PTASGPTWPPAVALGRTKPDGLAEPAASAPVPDRLALPPVLLDPRRPTGGLERWVLTGPKSSPSAVARCAGRVLRRSLVLRWPTSAYRSRTSGGARRPVLRLTPGPCDS